MRGLLTYHSIDSSGSPISIDPATFAANVNWLASGAVRVVSVEELWEAGDGGDAVAVTFDDALASFAEHAWPRLAEHHLPVTLFVPTGHVGATNDWSGKPQKGIPTLPLSDWETLARLAEEGVTLGAHGSRHCDLRALDDAELARELHQPAEEIARRTGTRPRVLAYPYGLVDRRVARAAAGGYRLGVTTELRPLRADDDPLRLPRIDTWYLRRPGLLERWGSPRLRSYLALRSALRRGRTGLRRLATAPAP